jgi:hypothetical protein
MVNSFMEKAAARRFRGIALISSEVWYTIIRIGRGSTMALLVCAEIFTSYHSARLLGEMMRGLHMEKCAGIDVCHSVGSREASLHIAISSIPTICQYSTFRSLFRLLAKVQQAFQSSLPVRISCFSHGSVPVALESWCPATISGSQYRIAGDLAGEVAPSGLPQEQASGI